MSKLLFSVAVVFTAVLINTKLKAQSSENLDRQNLQWYQVYLEKNLTADWSLVADGGFRWTNWMSDASQYITRVGLKRKLRHSFSVVGGLAHLGFYSDDGLSRLEYRSYQDLNHRHTLSIADVSHRLRIEQRFFSNEDGTNSFNWRHRYRLLFTLPLKKSSNLISLKIGNEILVNSGKQASTFFNQNRILIGPSVKIKEQISLSMLYTHFTRGTRREDNRFITDLLWLGVQLRY